jgi:SAM-dependent methyltransferase
MPTVPPEPAPSAEPSPAEPPAPGPPRPETLHQARQLAESFGTDAARYDRSRPRYPGALIEAVLAGAPGRDILDVGCGTGIVARQFQAAGGRVLGVEPDARMAELARRLGTEVEVARIEDWDPAGRRFDAVVAGQAWHWIDAEAGAARAAQALRPSGRLAVFWNAAQAPDELAAAFEAVYRGALPEFPSGWSGSAADGYGRMADRAAAGFAAAGGFGPARRWRFEWDHEYERDEWLDTLPTGGNLTRAAPEVVAAILDGVGAAIDAAGGRFTMHYTTVTATASRLDTA